MQKVTIQLETVTPMFLGGADARGEPELRAASFRGAMRYWLRALLGGKLGDNKEALSKLKKIEGSVFGITNSENDVSTSAVTIRITRSLLKQPETFKKEGTRSKPTGSDYLYWSMNESEKDLHDQRKYIAPDSSFNLIISVRPGIENSQAILNKAVASLWLLTHLGGIGARSHHLAGNISIKSPVTFDDINFKIEIGTHAEVAKQLSGGISGIRNNVSLNEIGIISDKASEFDILHPKFCNIWLLGIWNDRYSAVDSVGKRYHEFRNNKPEGLDAASWLLARSIFGLPIQGISGVERRTSPLWLSLVPVGDKGHCAVIATLFKSRFLERGIKLNIETVSHKKLKDKEPPSDFSLIEKWVSDKFPKKVEVSL